MKRLVTLPLALVMVFSLIPCDGSGEKAASFDYKIGIIIGTVSRGEEYQPAKMGDKIFLHISLKRHLVTLPFLPVSSCSR